MSLIARARIAGQTSQQVFDVLLRTLAEPGTVSGLPVDELAAEIPRPLWLALALGDVDLAVSVDGDATSEWASLVRDATGATTTGIADAWIVVLQFPSSAAVRAIPIGTALAPERGARVAIAVADLAEDGAGELSLDLAGPGVPGGRRLGVTGLAADVAALIGHASGTFPTGFDTWLFTPDGRVAAISRSTIVTLRRA